MDPRLITAIEVVVGVPAVLVAYIWGTEQVLRVFPERMKPRLRPWMWLAPALAFLGIFLVYPTIGTIVRSFQSRDILNPHWVGIANFQWFFGSDSAITALRNNVIWLVFLTLFAVGFGLLIAVLVDRVRYESVAKSVIFLPLAISMVAAGVIWLFMYSYQAPGTTQIGTLNGALQAVGTGPYGFIQNDSFALNTIFIIIVMAWMWTGFAMVILSASLKGINPELLEAARVDGATEWQVFRRIIFPLLVPTIAVVSTTVVITALKAFDIVYTMTNGQFSTDVIANLMYKQMFNSIPPQFGRGAAIAVILLLAVIPIMAFNVRQFRAQEAVR
jgi:alpha-glucoside transport system permease protein